MQQLDGYPFLETKAKLNTVQNIGMNYTDTIDGSKVYHTIDRHFSAVTFFSRLGDFSQIAD